MTCLGGSERGTCACICPSDCFAQNDTGFAAARERAKAAMGRYLMNRIAKSPVGVALVAARFAGTPTHPSALTVSTHSAHARDYRQCVPVRLSGARSPTRPPATTTSKRS